MSNFQAIGAVSATLKRLLQDRMELPPSTQIDVTVSSLQSEQGGNSTDESERINLFLYRVSENGSLKNQEIPGQGHPAAYGRPPLSLDLHYLLTAYGTSNDGEFVDESLSQQILGSAMRVLHDFPIITEQVLTEKSPAGQQILEESLRDEYERVKVTLDPLTLEDMSKVWTALTLPYRLSTAYRVSVIQIDSKRQRRIALPVQTRRVHVATQRRPQITDLYRTPGPGQPIGDRRLRIGDPMTLDGLNFKSPMTRIRLGALEAVPAPQVSLIADKRIELTIPDDPLIQAGPLVAEVRVERATEVVEGGLDKGTVTFDAKMEASNQTVFLVVPSLDPNNLPSHTSAGPDLDLVTVHGDRLYQEGGRSALLLGDQVFEVTEPGASDPWAAPSATQIEVAVPKLVAGTYSVRARANGAESTEDNVTLVVP